MSRLLSLWYALAPHLSVRPFALSHDRTGHKIHKWPRTVVVRTWIKHIWVYTALLRTLYYCSLFGNGEMKLVTLIPTRVQGRMENFVPSFSCNHFCGIRQTLISVSSPHSPSNERGLFFPGLNFFLLVLFFSFSTLSTTSLMGCILFFPRLSPHSRAFCFCFPSDLGFWSQLAPIQVDVMHTEDC